LRSPVSTSEMRAIEQKGMELGITRLVMMENAGSCIANYIHTDLAVRFGNQEVRVVGVAGTGNNGGDVLASVRHLSYWPNYLLSVVLVGREDDIRAAEARTNWDILSKVTKIKRIIIDSESFGLLENEISIADVLIIGIFGTGFKGIPKSLQLGAITAINKVKKPFKVSADIPSGMEADSGISDYAVKSDATVTMHAPKIGMLTPEGLKNSGKIIEANLGLPF
jgi:hydroxyethylthiazole kinase-like uncharacterized protein yjeF